MSFEALVATTLPAFIGLNLIIMGFAAAMTGSAIARTWGPYWHVCAYCVLLALASRFLTYALFGGGLLSPTGYLIDLILLTTIGLLSHRMTYVNCLVGQYPWLYRHHSPFFYRNIANDPLASMLK